MTKWDKAIRDMAEYVFDPGNRYEVEERLKQRIVPLLDAIDEMCISQPTTKRLREELTKWLK